MSIIKVNEIQKRTGSTLTIGGACTAVTLASGATQSGFGRTGTVDWCTTAKTSPFTATSGKGFFINTTSGGVTVTLPSSPSAGDIVSVSDYAKTAACNAITVGRGGSKIDGLCTDLTLETAGVATTLVYVDGTKGWKPVNSNEVKNELKYVTATGGTVTTSGDYKIHTFTSDANFIVSCAGGVAGSNKVSYVVVAGGGGAGGDGSGGGGAGGYREGKCSSDPYTASPLAATPCSGLEVPVATYPITIGGGGAGGPQPQPGANGNPSIFSSITSTAGGLGGQGAAGNGGSGGGGGRSSPRAAGTGNTPPVNPAQGTNGGSGGPPNGGDAGGGGGGATVAGSSNGPGGGGAGGAGATSSINGTPTARAGGGGGGTTPAPASKGAGGAGGGGNGAGCGPSGLAVNGTANTGGGGGGSSGGPGIPITQGGSGGSGVVIIRYKFQN